MGVRAELDLLRLDNFAACYLCQNSFRDCVGELEELSESYLKTFTWKYQ